MHTILPCGAALILVLGAPIALLAPTACAQAQEAAPEPPKQIALTDQQIQNFSAAQPEIGGILQKIPPGSGEPDPKTIAALDAVAKKYNFADYAEYDAVASNIGIVMSGIDPQTKKYIGAEAVLKEQIAAVKADKSMSPQDKKQALDDLHGQLGAAQPATIPGNIELVTKYYDKLAADTQQND
jgi:hypothetical protein